jgi:hypothetical protein
LKVVVVTKTPFFLDNRLFGFSLFSFLSVSFNKEKMATPSPNPGGQKGQKGQKLPSLLRHGRRRFRYEGGGGGGDGQLTDDFQVQSTGIKMTQQQKKQMEDVIQHRLFAICDGFNDIVLNNNKQKLKTRSQGGPLQQFQISKDLKDSIRVTLGNNNPLSEIWYTILCYRSLSLEGSDFQTREPQAHEIVNSYKKTVENPIKENLTKKINVILLEGLKRRIRQDMRNRYQQTQQDPPSQQEINQQVRTQIQRFSELERERAGYIAIQVMTHVHIELLTFFQQELGGCF